MDKAGPAALAMFFGVGAMPTIIFGLLIVFGELAWLPGLIAWAICMAIAAGFSILLGRDILLMTNLVRALQTNPKELPDETVLLIPGMRSLGFEANRLVRAERLMRTRTLEGSAQDRALVERLPDALFKLDATGALVWRNEVAINAFGSETAAILRHPQLRSALQKAIASGKPERCSVVISAPVVRNLDATIIPAEGPIYVLLADRTRERSLEKMRADFVANSSHELRTPLASLIGFIETLQGPAADDPESQKRFLGIMAEQAARMQRVIADLLSLSRIEISEHQPPEEIIDIKPLLERIIAAMEPISAANNTSIRMETRPLPMVPADADQLAQVFTNLLDNAIKYGKKNGCIKVLAQPSDNDPRFMQNGVVVSVRDDGAGIPREHLPRLTERFYRVDKGRSRAVGGTGLGLAIVKHAVNRHRGRLLVESVEGEGSEFTIWLPARA